MLWTATRWTPYITTTAPNDLLLALIYNVAANNWEGTAQGPAEEIFESIDGAGYQGIALAKQAATTADDYRIGFASGTNVNEPAGLIIIALKGGEAAPIPFSDDFGTDGALSVTGWTAYQASALPSAAKVAGQYNSGSITEVGATTWYNADRGRADWKRVPFPLVGEPDVVIVATNVGVGPSTDPSGNLGEDTQFAFCGLLVHLEDRTSPNYEFLVVGMRIWRPTLESKTTIAGTSDPADVGTDPLGGGLTHADVRLTLRPDLTARWAYRAPHSNDPWIEHDFGAGAGVANGGGLTFSSGAAWVGLITYGFSAVPVPFTGTCDALTLMGESGGDAGVSVFSSAVFGSRIFRGSHAA
jgi:hypothetical protein